MGRCSFQSRVPVIQTIGEQMGKPLEVMSKESTKEESKSVKDLGNTKVFIEEYKGNKIFSVFQVDEQGNKTKDRPEAAVGMHKATALAKHANELANWVNGVQGK
jgi:hypothetical protein